MSIWDKVLVLMQITIQIIKMFYACVWWNKWKLGAVNFKTKPQSSFTVQLLQIVLDKQNCRFCLKSKMQHSLVATLNSMSGFFGFAFLLLLVLDPKPFSNIIFRKYVFVRNSVKMNSVGQVNLSLCINFGIMVLYSGAIARAKGDGKGGNKSFPQNHLFCLSGWMGTKVSWKYRDIWYFMASEGAASAVPDNESDSQLKY